MVKMYKKVETINYIIFCRGNRHIDKQTQGKERGETNVFVKKRRNYCNEVKSKVTAEDKRCGDLSYYQHLLFPICFLLDPFCRALVGLFGRPSHTLMKRYMQDGPSPIFC